MVWLAIAFYLIFSLQLARSLELDAFQQSGTRIDILGFWVSLILSIALALKFILKKALHSFVILAIIILIGYVTLVFTFTDSRTPIEAFLISRHGILMWFLLGVGAGATLAVFANLADSRMKYNYRWLISGIMIITLTNAAMIALDYLAQPVFTESYQPASGNAIVLLVINFLILEALWPRANPKILVVALGVTAINLTAAIALMQSTLIVLFGGIFLLMLAKRAIQQSRHPVILTILLAGTLLGLLVGFEEEFFSIVERTRFVEFLGIGDGFSPVNNRIDLLANFYEQFRVSPIFGHYNVENIVYTGQGLYVHSLPLSFLTHTGMIGFSLFMVVVVSLFWAKFKIIGSAGEVNRDIISLLFLLLIIGSVATFFTWSVFWFILGVAAVKVKNTPLEIK